jgi:hypothetical protein
MQLGRQKAIEIFDHGGGEVAPQKTRRPWWDGGLDETVRGDR